MSSAVWETKEEPRQEKMGVVTWLHLLSMSFELAGLKWFPMNAVPKKRYYAQNIQYVYKYFYFIFIFIFILHRATLLLNLRLLPPGARICAHR